MALAVQIRTTAIPTQPTPLIATSPTPPTDGAHGPNTNGARRSGLLYSTSKNIRPRQLFPIPTPTPTAPTTPIGYRLLGHLTTYPTLPAQTDDCYNTNSLDTNACSNFRRGRTLFKPYQLLKPYQTVSPTPIAWTLTIAQKLTPPTPATVQSTTTTQISPTVPSDFSNTDSSDTDNCYNADTCPLQPLLQHRQRRHRRLFKHGQRTPTTKPSLTTRAAL